jgi:hypothetical protein
VLLLRTKRQVLPVTKELVSVGSVAGFSVDESVHLCLVNQLEQSEFVGDNVAEVFCRGAPVPCESVGQARWRKKTLNR